MHTTGSQKSTGCSSSQQSNLTSDSVQSSTLYSPNRGKRRERSEHIGNQSKQDLSSKIGDKITLSNQKHDNVMKGDALEFIINKDGVLDLSHVDRLILLMQQDHFDASVIAATEKEDFWRQYVQLGGLSILDEWLQGHKGSSTVADKSEEELILVILNILDKLPINLEALKACTIGKAVNHLRNHKNQEIQKEARKLVDVWKKRVEIDMKLKVEANGEADEDPSHGPKNFLVDKVPKSNTKTVDGMELTKTSTLMKNPLHLISSVQSTDSLQKEDSSILELNRNQEPLSLREDPTASSCLDLEEHNKGRKNCTLDTSESSDMVARDTSLAEMCPPEVKESKKCRLDKDEIFESATTSCCLVERNSSEICMLHEVADNGGIDDGDHLLLSGGIVNMTQNHCAESSYSANQGDPSTFASGDNGVANIGVANIVCGKQEFNGKLIKELTDDKIKVIPVSLGKKHKSTLPCHPSDIPNSRDCQEILIEGDSDIGMPETSRVPSKSGILNDTVGESNDMTREKATDNKTSVDSQPCIESALVMVGYVPDGIESDTEKLDCHVPLAQKAECNALETMEYISSQTKARESQKSQSSGCEDTFMEQDKMDVLRTEDDKISAKEIIFDSVENCIATKISTEICPVVADISKLEDGGVISESFSRIDEIISFEPPSKETCHDFDLNEGLLMDDLAKDDASAFSPSAVSNLVGAVTSGFVTAPVAIVAAIKGGYFLPVSSIQNTGEVGWKGSAATSAFRPAEPRHASGRTLATADMIPSQNTAELLKPVRNVLNFDLNIANEGLDGEEDISSENGACHTYTQKRERLSLDLNHVDDGRECAMADIDCATERKQIDNSRPDIRDLDLNDCPVEEAGHESVLSHSASENVGIFNPSFVGGLAFSSRIPGFQGVSFPSLNMTRIDPPFSVGSTEPLLSFRQASLPASAAASYPTIPSFFGTSYRFIPNMQGNSLPFAPGNSPYPVSACTVGTVPISLASSQKPGLREVVPVLVPPVIINARELGESANFYAWGRQDIDLHATTTSSGMENMDFGMNDREPSIYPDVFGKNK